MLHCQDEHEDTVVSRWRIPESMGTDSPMFEIACLKTLKWECGGRTKAHLEKFRDEGLDMDIS